MLSKSLLYNKAMLKTAILQLDPGLSRYCCGRRWIAACLCPLLLLQYDMCGLAVDFGLQRINDAVSAFMLGNAASDNNDNGQRLAMG